MKIEVKTTEEMIDLGQKIGRTFKGGEILEMRGDVGAGKTTLTKGIAKGLDIEEPIQSPTFTISRVYVARDGLRLSHYDFYRLQDAGIMATELDEVIGDKQNITIVEWAEVVAGVLPDDRVVVSIRPTDSDGRIVDIEGISI